MKTALRLLSVGLWLTGQKSHEEPPPSPPACIDRSQEIIDRIVKSISKWENCPFNNPGCLRSASGYARFRTKKEGIARLENWWREHSELTLFKALSLYNAINIEYPKTILTDSGLSPTITIKQFGCAK